MFRVAAAFFLCVALSPLADAAYNPAPLSEVRAAEDLYKSVVTLRVQKAGAYFRCMGILFKDFRQSSPRANMGFVMTSGHCLRGASSVEVNFFPEAGREPVVRVLKNKNSWTRHSLLFEGVIDNSNAHLNHDIGIALVNNLPSHAVALGLAANLNLAEHPKIEYFTVTRDESERAGSVSALYTLPLASPVKFGLTASTDIALPATALLFGADVVQPEKGFRGGCLGDSGAPVIAVWGNEASLIGPHRGSSEYFTTSESRVCGKFVSFYNATFNHTWVVQAMNDVIARMGLPYNISSL